MAKVRNNMLVRGLSGGLGEQVVMYAHAAMMDARVHALYVEEAKRNAPHKRPFDLAVSDYFRGRNLLVAP